MKFCRLISDCHIVSSTPCNHRELNSVFTPHASGKANYTEQHEEGRSCTGIDNISETDYFCLYTLDLIYIYIFKANLYSGFT